MADSARRSATGSARTMCSILTLGMLLVAAILPAPGPALTERPIPGLDGKFRAIEASVPGFGGAYVDEEKKRLYIWSQSHGAEIGIQVRGLLSSLLGDPVLLEYAPVLKEASFTFTQLDEWQSLVTRELLGRDGVLSSDADEYLNRVSIGVDDLEARRESLSMRLRALSIPGGAVELHEIEPPREALTLQSEIRPLLGGIQVAFTVDFVTQRNCTLGFVAIRSVAGFVTNSHCSAVTGTNDSTIYGQNSIQSSDAVAIEIVDPPYFADPSGQDCPAGKRCRYSDALFAMRTSDNIPMERGKIAYVPNTSIVWNGVSKTRIVAKTDPMVGYDVAKIGRSSGNTSGLVQDACDDVFIPGTDRVKLCQSRASSIGAQDGDSGSPVFRTHTNSSDGILHGILWGSPGWFSAYSLIELELGALTVCAPGFAC